MSPFKSTLCHGAAFPLSSAHQIEAIQRILWGKPKIARTLHVKRGKLLQISSGYRSPNRGPVKRGTIRME
ncbi:Uncharacterized protein HZ326_11845 [Fusarium oxysporum f. sp. albedinis]|nr:Uncharacterized protein HZ326_11845 [Fusarium oxysporum f. sp. albedinis]